MKKATKNLDNNGSEPKWPPHYTDYLNPTRLTQSQKELIEATREAMKTLKEEEAKYGKKDFSNF